MTCWTGFSANFVLANETPGDNKEDSIQERRCSKLCPLTTSPPNLGQT
jgi:hypothetical protein